MDDKEEREEFLKIRGAFEQALMESSKGFDKAILTLTGGSLALSIAYRKDIAPRPYVGLDSGATLPLVESVGSLAALHALCVDRPGPPLQLGAIAACDFCDLES